MHGHHRKAPVKWHPSAEQKATLVAQKKTLHGSQRVHASPLAKGATRDPYGRK